MNARNQGVLLSKCCRLLVAFPIGAGNTADPIEEDDWVRLGQGS